VAVPLLVLFLPQMFFYGLTALGSALLNARQFFAVPAFAPVLNNVVVICLFLALPRLAGGDQPTFDQVSSDRGLQLLLGLGTTAGIVAMTAVLWPALRHAGIRLRWRFDLRNPADPPSLRGPDARRPDPGSARAARTQRPGGR